MEYTRIEYDEPAAGVARIMLARADRANAQDKSMLYEVDAALARAARDDDVRCIVIAAKGENFSSGHDLRDASDLAEFPPATLWGGFGDDGQAGQMAAEHEMYLGLCLRWRNLPKPVVVQVQGLCMAGGLVLVWPFDIVIASDDARFCDPTVAFGVNGVEYFAHVWELGHRKAREMLFAGGVFSAAECLAAGMVNRVVPRHRLEDTTLAMASRIAQRPLVALRIAKLSCNQSLDAQGYSSAIAAAMAWQQVGHANARLLHGGPVDPAGAAQVRAAGAEKPVE